MRKDIAGACTLFGLDNSPAPSGSVTIRNAHISGPAFTASDNSFVVRLAGTAYLSSGGELSEDTVEEFISRFRRSPEESLRSLDGAFALAVLCDTGDCWLATDHFGTLPLHYRVSAEGIVFGSSMSDVRSGDSSLDQDSLLVYFGLGLTLAGATYYQGVRRLGNATILRWSPDGHFTELQYYRPNYTVADRPLEDSLESIRSVLTEGLTHRLRGRGLMAALTGGLDSRMTWAMILGSNEHIPLAHTHGVPSAHDLTIARQIAEGLHLSHDVVELDEACFRDLPQMWREIASLGEGVVPVQYALMLPVLEHQRKLGVSALLDSYGGAFYRRQRMKVAELRIDSKADLVSQIMPYEYSALLRSGLLNPGARAQVLSASEAALRSYYETIEHVSGVGNKLDLYHLEQVNPLRDSMLTKLESGFRTTVHPLMNHRAIDLAATLPLRVRRRDLVHKYVIGESYPALEKFTLDNVGFPVPYHGSTYLRYGAMILERVGRMLVRSGITTGRRLMLRKPTFSSTQQIPKGLGYLREVLSSTNCVVAPYLNTGALQTAFERCDIGDYKDADALLQLLTLELYLKQN